MKSSKEKSTTNNGKISDFFSTKSDKSQKRRLSSDSSNPDDVLAPITNKSPKIISPSKFQIPNGKKIKCDENVEMNKTPEKYSKPSTSRTKSPCKSPAKGKKSTPKKLFEKSPKKLEEFNVEVLKNFVKVTPSKSNSLATNNDSTPSKVNQVQASIVYYMSPSSSEIQARNETTPKKTPQSQNNGATPSSKVKTKLNFAPSAKKEAENCFPHFPDDTFDCFLNDFEQEESLELTNQRCTITQVIKDGKNIILHVKAQNSTATCSIRGFWTCCNFQHHAKVFLEAVRAPDGWFIDNENGFLVYEPDLLISCTSVVRNVFCMRNSVLQERYQAVGATNKVMLIGTTVHLILQTALKNKLTTIRELEQLLEQKLAESTIVRKLYECNLTMSDIEVEMREVYLPKIHDFLRQYVTNEAKPASNNWQGRIAQIDDIEDNLWCPTLGLKGKIDLTVKTGKNELIPIEVKTGRASMSLEHRGQVMLYIMMMNKLGFKVSSGLLLYLKEGTLKDVPASKREQRDIMVMRNEFTAFLKEKVQISEMKFSMPKLPDSINNARMCSKCSSNVVCTALLRQEKYDYTNPQMKELENEVTLHLSDEHINYFTHWSTLLHLEMENEKASKSLKDIFTIPPDVREKTGRCLSNLKIESISSEPNDIFLHVFVKAANSTNFLTSGINESNYIIVSTDARMAIAMGFVKEVTPTSLSLSLDRNLNEKYKGRLFHLDSYDSQVSSKFSFDSLAMVLENTERADQLRRIIIDYAAPLFVQKLPAVVAKHGKAILKQLNRVQQKAALTALTAQSFVLIKGMPGTGKTSTIVAIIRLLVLLKKTVMICSHTHAAVDNVCLRLKQVGVEFIRLGNNGKIGKRLRENCEAVLVKDCRTPEDLDGVYNGFNVIGVTCLGSNHPMLSRRPIDVCIVDESTQVLQPTLIRPLSLAKMFILIGDPEQLSPVVKSPDAIANGMGESLFERLNKQHAQQTIALTLNYRMNKVITKLANAFTYNNTLIPANEAVAEARLQLATRDGCEEFIVQALSCDIDHSIRFIDTGAVWKLDAVPKWYNSSDLKDGATSNLFNVYELVIVVRLVECLIAGGIDCADIGVMATYTAQVNELSAALTQFNVQVNTVDQFQGQDKSVIIYSCTKSKDMSKRLDDLKFDILEDKKRLTVAITRAKHKLILIGDVSTLKNYKTFTAIFEHIQKEHIINLSDQLIYEQLGKRLK